jgi:hypothetical protein
MFPLSTVLFPHAEMPLHVFEPRYRALTKDALAGDSRFGIVLIERGSEVGGGDQRMAVGTSALITKSVELSDGRWLLMVQGDRRLQVIEWLAEEPYPLAQVEEWPPTAGAAAPALVHRAEQCVRRTRGLLSESGRSPALSADVRLSDDPDTAAWQLCAEAPLNPMDAQRLLTAPDSEQRLEWLIGFTEAVAQDLHRLMAGE